MYCNLQATTTAFCRHPCMQNRGSEADKTVKNNCLFSKIVLLTYLFHNVLFHLIALYLSL